MSTHLTHESDDLLTRFTSALDCCGTCAGGVLAQYVRQAKAAALREAHDEIFRLDPPEYLDAPQYREGLIDGYGMAAAVVQELAERVSTPSGSEVRDV